MFAAGQRVVCLREGGWARVDSGADLAGPPFKAVRTVASLHYREMGDGALRPFVRLRERMFEPSGEALVFDAREFRLAREDEGAAEDAELERLRRAIRPATLRVREFVGRL
jgi:hypothetical protein